MILSINESNCSIANIETLPKDIIVKIFVEVFEAFNAGIDNYNQCRLVSKKFHQICRDEQLWNLIARQLGFRNLNPSFWKQIPALKSLHCYVAQMIDPIHFLGLPDISEDLRQEARRNNYIDVIREIQFRHLTKNASLAKGVDDYERSFIVCRCIDRSKNPPQEIIMTIFHESFNSEQWCYRAEPNEVIFSNEKLNSEDKQRLGRLLRHESLGFYPSGPDNQEKNLTEDGKSILELQ